MEKDWGESHFAILYAKISDNITLKDANQRVLELVTEHIKDSKNEKEKAQRLIMFQILCEGCKPEEYEYTKENGT